MNKEDKDGFTEIKIDSSGKLLMIVGGSGSGKTVLVQNIAYQSRRYAGMKVIYITEKPQSSMENSFCCLDKISEGQDRALERSMVPDTERYPEKVEIFHPFTFNFPKTLVPDNIKLFSLSIKDVDEDSYGALLGRDVDSPSVLLCQSVADELSEKDDIFSFLFKAYQLSSSKDSEAEIKTGKLSEKNMWIPFETYGSKRDIDQIKVTFKNLAEDYLLQPSNSPMNLSDEKLIKMIRDRETLSMFTMWKIKDKKTKYFTYIELLKRLNNVIVNNRHPPILIILEEIKILLPKTTGDKEKYKEKLAEVLREMLAGLRSSNVTLLATTQSYYETNSDFRDGIISENVMIMKLSSEDVKSIGRDFRLNSENFNTLTTLRTGEFVFFNDIQSTQNVAEKFKVFHVPFGHREPGYDDYIHEFRKLYPDRMVTLKQEIKDVRVLFNKSSKVQKKRVTEWEQSKRKKKKEEESSTKVVEKKLSDTISDPDLNKEEVEDFDFEDDSVRDTFEPPSKRTLYKGSNRQKVGRKGYDIVMDTPSSSWKSRLVLIEDDISEALMKKVVSEYAISIKDYEFMKSTFQKKYVKSNYLDIYEDIFNEKP